MRPRWTLRCLTFLGASIRPRSLRGPAFPRPVPGPRDPALAVPLAARHLGPAEAAPALHPHAQGPGPHSRLDAPAHGSAEGDPPGQLLGHALGEQRAVGLRPELARRRVHVLDLYVDPLLGHPLDVPADPVDLGALAADHDARAGRADEHPDLVAFPLDVDAGDAGPGQ